MRELTLDEIDEVDGGLTLGQGRVLITGAAFGGGVLLGMELALNFY